MPNWRQQLAERILRLGNKRLLQPYYRIKPAFFPSHQHLLQLYAERTTDVFFVQIGAHEGRARDPLFRHILLDGWAGILVEPQPDAFQKLKKSYGRLKNLRFEAVAIDEKSGQRPFYYVEPQAGLPAWVNQLSSFHRDVPAIVLAKFPMAMIKTVTVDCLSLNDLLVKHAVATLKVLIIDAEGHDATILQSLDFNSYTPDLILYEHYHLSKDVNENCRQLLKERQYAFFVEGHNTMAIRANDDLQKLYREYLD